MNDRLSRLKAEGDNHLTDKFSSMMDDRNDFDRLKYFNGIEKEVLQRFFTTIQTCLNKLLYITKEKSQMSNLPLDSKNAAMIGEVLHHMRVSTVSYVVDDLSLILL